MESVVEEELLLRSRVRLELPAPHGVLHGDRQGDLGDVDPGAADADPALDQRAEHGEEAPVRVLDRARVDAFGGDVGEPVEQRLARHPYAVEPDAAVVDAVEAHLASVVLDADAGHDPAAGPERHEERVHALGRAVHLQLGEDDGQFGVAGGVADVVLARPVVGGGEDELLSPGVVPGDGAERLDVGAVAALGHREAAHQAPGDQVRQMGRVVALGAQVQDRAAEEPELHAALHQDRQVAEGQRLERGDRGPDVTAPAVLAREAHAGLPRRGHRDHDLAHPFAERVDAEFPRPPPTRRSASPGWSGRGRGSRRTRRRAPRPGPGRRSRAVRSRLRGWLRCWWPCTFATPGREGQAGRSGGGPGRVPPDGSQGTWNCGP